MIFCSPFEVTVKCREQNPDKMNLGTTKSTCLYNEHNPGISQKPRNFSLELRHDNSHFILKTNKPLSMKLCYKQIFLSERHVDVSTNGFSAPKISGSFEERAPEAQTQNFP